MIRIFGRALIKKFVCDEIADFKGSILLTLELLDAFFSRILYELLRNTYFKVGTVMVSSVAYFFKL